MVALFVHKENWANLDADKMGNTRAAGKKLWLNEYIYNIFAEE